MATPADRFDGSRIAALQVRGPAGSGLRLAAGEMPVAVQPRLSSTTAPDGERRLNAFAGRALTAPLLQAEQDARARRLALLNRALSAGVVSGLGLAFDDAPVAADLAAPRRMSVDAGSGLTAGGEEVIVPAALGFDALALPVVAPPWLLSDADEAPELPPGASVADGSVLLPRATGRPLRALAGLGRPVPRAGLVLLQPVEHRRVDGADPFDQCERDLDAEAFEDQVRQDAACLVFYPWPDEWLPLPAPGDAWRNLLAHRIFEREAQLLADGGQGSQAMPWHAVGVPLALVAFDADWRPLFADRAAVVRAGGRPRGGPRFLWQARIDQLGEHLAEAAAAGAHNTALSRQLRVLPPAGLLPRDAIDARGGTQRFFPSTLDVTAVPLPIEQLDHVFEAAAGLAPVDLAVRDRIVVHVPVPQTVWTPDLLTTEVADADGAIAAAIERDVEARADWLRRRQRQRVQQHALQLAADGPVVTDPVIPAADDPARLEDERFDARVPAPAGLLHRSARAAGVHQHYLDRATRTLALQPGDQLYAWVLLDSEAPPRELMLQWQVGASWEHRAYWGVDLIAWGQDGTPSRLQQSTAVPPAVPTTGTWQRLVMSPAALGLDGATVNGVAFTLFDGLAAFGPCGVLRDGAERPWLDRAALDSGTQRGDGEAWTLVDEAWRAVPFEAGYGTTTDNGVTTSTELAALVADPLVAQRALAPVTGDDSKLVPTEADPALRGFRSLPQLIATNGLRATVADLASRIDEADDAINLGYLRVQTDLYRLRQTVLKSSQASRFAVSPALTQIADLDNASATREQLSDFYDTVRTGKPVAAPADRTAPPVFTLRTRVVPRATEPAGMAGAAASSAGMAAAAASLGVNIASNVGGIGMAVGGTTASIGTLAALNVLKTVGGVQQPLPFINLAGAQTQLDLSGLIARGVLTGGVARAVDTTAVAPTPTPKTVTDASALTGKAEIRTTSIASRLERPRAIEAKDFTVATRLEVIGKLAALGLDLDDLDVPGIAQTPAAGQSGFDPAGQPLRAAPIKLKALRSRFTALASDPDPEDKARDESAYFLGGVDLSDHTIAVLRAAEGIVRGYRDALARCSKALAAIDGSLAALAPRLALIARELAEARQDVATARALLAEEIARATALNAQRDAIIDEHVSFLAFARPRASLAPAALPWRVLDNALEPDAVPACLAAHDEPPGDVAALLGIVRQAPADWFPAVRAHLALLDSHLAADRVLAALGPVSAAVAVTSVSATTLAAGLAGSGSQKTAFDAVRVQAEVIGRVRAQAQQAAGLALGAAAAVSMGLVEKIGLIARGAALADLAAAAAGRDELNRRVTAELGRIAQVATCLHARLSGVRAAVRLDWAERFSQFDAVGDLGDLSTLPHMAELPRDDCTDIVELAAWLRGRADRDNPRAVALMATLVRVCVLAASHSPAGQLLTGRLVRPVPLNPGVRFEVQPTVADRLRVGMAVRLLDPALGTAAVAAQAVVADVIGGIAHVQVTQVVRPGFVPGTRASVQFHLV
jgi:hypothetical protein